MVNGRIRELDVSEVSVMDHGRDTPGSAAEAGSNNIDDGSGGGGGDGGGDLRVVVKVKAPAAGALHAGAGGRSRTRIRSSRAIEA